MTLEAKSEYAGLHVVVTGGTGALGTAVVGELLDLGATCHVPVFAGAELEKFPHRGHGRVHTSAGVDLRDEAAVVAFFGELDDLWASIHCAGGFATSPLVETSLADYERMMDLNAATVFLSCREAVRRIRTRKGGPPGGRLVNVAARPALESRGGAGMAVYTASKAAVAALTVSLGEELASENIWVNAVAPGVLDTPANRRAMPESDPSNWAPLAGVARTIAFLASPGNTTTRCGLVPVYGAS